MAHDKYKPQLRLIKGGKLKLDDAPEEYAALCGELAGCLLEFIQHEVGMAVFSQKRKAITEKMEEYENTIAGQLEVEKLEPPTFATDEEEAEWYRENAERGNPFAQDHLGDMYSEGRGVPEDDDQAEEWWSKAAHGYLLRAERGDAAAQYRLGELFETGSGVPADEEQAKEWYTKAAEGYRIRAERGDTEALGKVIAMAKRSNEAALDALCRIGNRGNVDAQYNLGQMYYEGWGVPKDKKQARQWYRKAADWYRERAEQGDADAQYRLGSMYYHGYGVRKDRDQTREWYSKAADGYRERAEKGDAHALEQLRLLAEWRWANAQYHWGVLAETGRCGVHKNIMHAISWYRKAAKRGHEKAKEALERLSS